MQLLRRKNIIKCLFFHFKKEQKKHCICLNTIANISFSLHIANYRTPAIMQAKNLNLRENSTPKEKKYCIDSLHNKYKNVYNLKQFSKTFPRLCVQYVKRMGSF